MPTNQKAMLKIMKKSFFGENWVESCKTSLLLPKSSIVYGDPNFFIRNELQKEQMFYLENRQMIFKSLR